MKSWSARALHRFPCANTDKGRLCVVLGDATTFTVQRHGGGFTGGGQARADIARV